MNAPVLTTIHDRAMLTYLRIGSWSARKLDTKATKKVTDDAGASSDAARVNKHLLAASDDQLKKIQKIGGEARKYLDNHTLPWDDAGNRLLPNEKCIEVVGELTRYEQEYNAAVDAFIAEYPALRAQALHNLGDLANHEDYPAPDQVRHKFSFRLSFTPVPNGFSDVRTGLQDSQVEALKAHYEANTKRQMHEALGNAWARLRENLNTYSDRLQAREDDPTKMKIFRDSMVENLRETCALLRDLNVFADEDLERTRARVERDIACFDPSVIRDNGSIGAAVKSEVDAVLRHIQSIMGG